MSCIFCKIISKEIPAKILYEDDDTISFLDAFPVAKGHTLVIPKEHHEKIQDSTLIILTKGKSLKIEASTKSKFLLPSIKKS